MRRRNHPLVACLAILAMLFAQLATAAYACPQLVEPRTVQSDECDRDMASPNLCERHCEYGNVSFESGNPSALPDGVIAYLRPIPVPARRALQRRENGPDTTATGPPSPTRFTVLRI